MKNKSMILVAIISMIILIFVVGVISYAKEVVISTKEVTTDQTKTVIADTKKLKTDKPEEVFQTLKSDVAVTVKEKDLVGQVEKYKNIMGKTDITINTAVLAKEEMYGTTNWVIETANGFGVILDANTGKLQSIIARKNAYPKNTLSKEQVEEVAKRIYQALELEEKYENYTLAYVVEFDDEIWRASFQKEYEGVLSPYEAVNIAFAPESEELKLLIILEEENEENEITLSQEEAIEIVEENTTSEVKETKLAIRKANNLFYDKEEYIYYTKSDIIRTVWEVTLEDGISYYIDATTGDVLGGEVTVW